MKNSPKYIFLNTSDEHDINMNDDVDFNDLEEVTWSEDCLGPDDIQYIRIDQKTRSREDESIEKGDIVCFCKIEDLKEMIGTVLFKRGITIYIDTVMDGDRQLIRITEKELICKY